MVADRARAYSRPCAMSEGSQGHCARIRPELPESKAGGVGAATLGAGTGDVRRTCIVDVHINSRSRHAADPVACVEPIVIACPPARRSALRRGQEQSECQSDRHQICDCSSCLHVSAPVVTLLLQGVCPARRIQRLRPLCRTAHTHTSCTRRKLHVVRYFPCSVADRYHTARTVSETFGRRTHTHHAQDENCTWSVTSLAPLLTGTTPLAPLAKPS